MPDIMPAINLGKIELFSLFCLSTGQVLLWALYILCLEMPAICFVLCSFPLLHPSPILLLMKGFPFSHCLLRLFYFEVSESTHRDKWLKPLMSWHGSKFQQLFLDSIGKAFCRTRVHGALSQKMPRLCSFESVLQ